MQETINRLNTGERETSTSAIDAGRTPNAKSVHERPNAVCEGDGENQTADASAERWCLVPSAERRQDIAARSTKRRADAESDSCAEQKPDPQSLTGSLEIASRPLSNWRLAFSVFLPFAAGYYLSFLFRTINASITPSLASEFGLGAAQTGLLASVYFLIFAAIVSTGTLLLTKDRTNGPLD